MIGNKGSYIVHSVALNETALKHIKFLPNYADPYHKRAMTMGEIGCFLSHYNIWKEIVDKEYDSILVLEDDIRFEPFFRSKVQSLMQEVHQLGDWDLINGVKIQQSTSFLQPFSRFLFLVWSL
ncbi:Glycosyltransferase family 25 (LPS biosynthesis protein) [Popillia japonica]|uniref:Glycosyltransferase family 25 (LPS biosynthesis protein) n=1 Tax=Popillia japonica TaxID=7064 RepID=A0AAW1LF24_POPJA